MAVQEISINRALTTVKNLKKEIEEYFNEPRIFVIALQGTEDRVVAHGFDKAYMEKQMQSDYDSYINKLARYDALKAAIVKSNAETKVSINGQEYTVAAAVELKATVKFKETLLTHWKKQMATISKVVSDANAKLESTLKTDIDNINKSRTEADGDSAQEYIAALTRLNTERYTVKVHDYLQLATKIKELENEIRTINEELDWALSDSNMKTLISVDLG
jgi:hypothetical protein